MSTLDVGDLRARSVEFIATELVVMLAGGRRIATPLDWYPRLKHAAEAARNNYEIMPMGIHWSDIDEDLSIAGMLSAPQSRRLPNPANRRRDHATPRAPAGGAGAHYAAQQARGDAGKYDNLPL